MLRTSCMIARSVLVLALWSLRLANINSFAPARRALAPTHSVALGMTAPRPRRKRDAVRGIVDRVVHIGGSPAVGGSALLEPPLAAAAADENSTAAAPLPPPAAEAKKRVDRRIGRSGTPAVLREEEICLMPGEVVVRVEDAPNNARRIFTGPSRAGRHPPLLDSGQPQPFVHIAARVARRSR